MKPCMLSPSARLAQLSILKLAPLRGTPFVFLVDFPSLFFLLISSPYCILFRELSSSSPGSRFLIDPLVYGR
jgi:hypothetical protein